MVISGLGSSGGNKWGMSPLRLIRTSLFLTVALFCSNSMPQWSLATSTSELAGVRASHVMFIHIFIAVAHLGLIRKSQKLFNVHAGLFQSLRIFGIILRLLLLLPHARNEVYNGLDGSILLQLFCFSLLFPLVPRGPLVGGYPVDSNVN